MVLRMTNDFTMPPPIVDGKCRRSDSLTEVLRASDYRDPDGVDMQRRVVEVYVADMTAEKEI